MGSCGRGREHEGDVTPREIHDEIFRNGARVKEALAELAALVERLCNGTLFTIGGRPYRLKDGERRLALTPAWNRAWKRFRQGLGSNATDAGIEVFLKKVISSVHSEQLRSGRAEEDRAEIDRRAEPDAQPAREVVPRVDPNELLDPLEPLVAEHVARSRKRDREGLKRTWAELRARFADGTSIRTLLVEEGKITPATPREPFEAARQAFYMRHARFREGLERSLGMLERDRSFPQDQIELMRTILQGLVRATDENTEGDSDA